ncbi:leucine-rich repeat domain-containing protein [Lewinella cohaerens]|uniref:leucine-rich repeat domain-containing protein n=1 Tax=Lewinella cohaerens TaxID=70995 RepID=UPI000365C74B|nr:leucine-rich repeat domain-containing protein [Lewinella cohaerens]
MQQPQAWWNQLEDQWKLAFSQAVFHARTVYTPTDAEILDLWTMPVLRFASPGSENPNMGFDLTNLSGLKGFKGLELLFVIHHKITTLEEISTLTQLKQLVVYNNKIESLSGVEKMLNLEKLFIHKNKISSIAEVALLSHLQEISCFKNPLKSLEGLDVRHQPKLQSILAFPNEHLSETEIERAEKATGLSLEKGTRR